MGLSLLYGMCGVESTLRDEYWVGFTLRDVWGWSLL